MSWLNGRLRRGLWLLSQRAGYNVSSIAKQQERFRRERWRWLDTLDIGTLIDVGANTGQFARLFRDVRPDCLIYSFEPLRECFEELQQAMAGTPGFTAFNVALGDSDCEATFFRSESSPSSSLLPMGELHKELFPFTRNITPETVTVKRLDSYREEIFVRGGLLIKIDVQGAETKVLRGGRQFLSNADAVLAEVGYLSLYEGQATIQEISGFLDEFGLVFTGIVEQYLRPSDSLPVFGDALFVRRDALQPREDGSALDAIPSTPRGVR